MKVVTFGCRINSFESALIQQLAPELENTILVNTCAVTAEAERQCRQTIRKLKKENPQSQIIVAGCSAQLNPQMYMNMPEVDRILGNQEKLSKQNLFCQQKIMVGDIQNTDFAIPLISDFEGHTKAFIQIQQGCNHKCTFCVVNQVRGKNKGVPVEQIIKQAQLFVDKGYSEIILSGIDTTSYPYGLADLVEEIIQKVKGLKRLRFGSLDPAGIDEKLIHLFADNEILMPHIHLSIQSGDDTILRRMARRHRQKDVFFLTEKLRSARPDFVFGADFITGFPTETDAMFQNTLDLVQKANIFLLHIFPFSIRPSTPSASMQMVDPLIRKERAKILRQTGLKLLQSYLVEEIGKDSVVLVENNNQGFNEHYIPVKLEQPVSVGKIIKIQNRKVYQNGFMG